MILYNLNMKKIKEKKEKNIKDFGSVFNIYKFSKRYNDLNNNFVKLFDDETFVFLSEHEKERCMYEIFKLYLKSKLEEEKEEMEGWFYGCF